MKKGMKAALIVLAALIILVAVGYMVMRGQADGALSSITYADVDMSRVVDGTFYGETKTDLVVVKVSVTVQDHTIKSIEIMEHQNGLGGKAEMIKDMMIKQNTFQVDVVSGATLSSSAIKSAVSMALAEGSR